MKVLKFNLWTVMPISMMILWYFIIVITWIFSSPYVLLDTVLTALYTLQIIKCGFAFIKWNKKNG
jgi:membrane protein YdbS with pleckstrin-like domain